MTPADQTGPDQGTDRAITDPAGPGLEEWDRPPLVPPVQMWQCCHCGGTGLDSYGDTCPHCHGNGHC